MRTKEEAKAYRKEYYSRPGVLERYREKRQNDPRMSLVHHAKDRSKKFNLEFDLVQSDIVIPKVCPLLEIPIFVSKTGRPCGNSPTLDRVDNSKGYTKDNVRVISHKANSMKREHTQETLERFLKYVKGEI